MKKNFLFIAFAVVLCWATSCNKEDFTNSDFIVSQGELLTRNENDFDPLNEISNNNVPVYIRNVGKGNTYMSEVGTSVLLEASDDGSARQRWIINKFGLGLDISPITQPDKSIHVVRIGGESICRPYLSDIFPLPGTTGISMISISNSVFYYICSGSSVQPGFPITYLQRESKESNNLIFGNSNVADWAKWEISPVGEYTIEDIEYSFYDGGSLDSSSVIIDNYTVDNRKSSVSVKRTQTMSHEISESSTFSKTEGISTEYSISTSSSSGIQVGLPKVTVNSNSEISISTSTTKHASYVQGEDKGEKQTITCSYKVTVPPYTYYSIKTLVKEYRMNVRYIATLKGADNVTFRVKGTWSGVQAIDTYQEAFDEKNNLVEADIRPIEF